LARFRIGARNPPAEHPQESGHGTVQVFLQGQLFLPKGAGHPYTNFI
jgi:hypothetical protein